MPLASGSYPRNARRLSITGPHAPMAPRPAASSASSQSYRESEEDDEEKGLKEASQQEAAAAAAAAEEEAKKKAEAEAAASGADKNAEPKPTVAIPLEERPVDQERVNAIIGAAPLVAVAAVFGFFAL